MQMHMYTYIQIYIIILIDTGSIYIASVTYVCLQAYTKIDIDTDIDTYTSYLNLVSQTRQRFKHGLALVD